SYGESGGAATWMRRPCASTTWPARILQVLRSSTAPSTRTAPLATSALPAPPLSTTPHSFSSWLSSTWSPSSSNVVSAMAPSSALQFAQRRRRRRVQHPAGGEQPGGQGHRHADRAAHGGQHPVLAPGQVEH